jgi:hydroxymethylbilane synthase
VTGTKVRTAAGATTATEPTTRTGTGTGDGTGLTLRLGTRRSLLATTQSGWVADRLVAAGLADRVELVEVTTHGDVSTAPLASMGGTGVFVTALREALLAGRVDLAVHSLKDLPTTPAPGLVLAAVPPREDPADVVVARDGLTLDKLPPGSRVGTGSPRRAAQLRAMGLGLDVVDLRGNVDTRLRAVSEGRLDAVVLARAGIARLDRLAEVTETLAPERMLPAPGQGALAVECRAAVDDRTAAVLAALQHLDDLPTRTAVTAERVVLRTLEAGCSAPLGALATVTSDRIRLDALLASPDGSAVHRARAEMPLPPGGNAPSGSHIEPAWVTAAARLGRDLAAELLVAAGPLPGPKPAPFTAQPRGSEL